jgi:hypothetical protein
MWFNFFKIRTEDTYYGSGSGSGDDDEDTDGDSGSGLGPYIIPAVSKTPVDQTTLHTIEKNININAGNTNVFPGIPDDSSESIDTNSNEDMDGPVQPSHENEKGATEPSITTSWRFKRILLTYFLPIIVTWLGGICTDL